MSKTSACQRKSVYHPNQLRLASAVFRGKWSIAILCAMRDGPVRLGQMTRLVPDASKKVLLENLKRLESTGIVVRNDRSQRVLHVEYGFHERTKETICQLLDCFIAAAEFLAENENPFSRTSLAPSIESEKALLED